MPASKYPRISLMTILTYPMNLSSIMIIVVTAMFISTALMGLLMAVIVVFGLGMFSLWFTKYAFTALIHTAEGFPDIPDFGESIIRPFEDFRPAKLIIIVVVHITIIGELLTHSYTLGYCYGILFLVFLPAIISELAMDNNLLKTFDIRLLAQIIKLSGAYYWLSFGFYILISILVYNLYKSEIGMFFAVMVTLYFILVSFHLIGLTLYTRREAMGYATAHSPEQLEKDDNEEQLKQYHRISTNLYSRYRQPSAIPYLENALKSYPIEAYDWFYHDVMRWEIKPKFKRNFLQLYCRKLCEANKKVKAYTQYKLYCQSDNEFKVEDSTMQLCILNVAIQQNETTIINSTYEDLLVNFSDSENHKSAGLLLLKFYTEIQPDKDKASILYKNLSELHPKMEHEK